MRPKTEKTLYGLKHSPRNFYLQLKDKLKWIGFESLEFGRCLFTSDKVICLIYVNNTLLYSNNMKAMDDCIATQRNAGMGLEVEENVAGCPGVHIVQKYNGKILMTQMGLTGQIVKALNIRDKPFKKTPPVYGCLGKD